MKTTEDFGLHTSVGVHVPACRWIASLSNGLTVFEDRTPGIKPAWERLSHYVKENKLAITRLRVQLGKLELHIDPHKPGYIQKKKVCATPGAHIEKFCVGYTDGRGKALIHTVASDGSSTSSIEADPGEPFTIYDWRDGG